ncbi:LysR family transcriptional regulator [Polaromonas sp. YR568]|uniref:LysR family transcriptional regulator n=1 Tax=Polaromonas sp. YR568 TaxID=1855301 RepID=UPI00398BE2B0
MTMLRVFEATARYLSFTRAAEELFLTQSAVSKQIKALEDQLGRAMFMRGNRGLMLTPIGESFYREISPLLTSLEKATENVMDCGGVTKLTLHVFATLGERWLMDRFPKFARAHPDIEVVFTPMLSSDGQKQLKLDGDFRIGAGIWPGYVADYLFGREMLLVGSPELLERKGGLSTPADIIRFPWLQHFQVPHAWDELSESIPQLATSAKLGQAPQASMYEFYNILIRAAVGGLGLALVPRIWITSELAGGKLVNPLSIGIKSKFGYFFVVPEHQAELKSVAALRSWLVEEAKQTQREVLGLPS